MSPPDRSHPSTPGAAFWTALASMVHCSTLLTILDSAAWAPHRTNPPSLTNPGSVAWAPHRTSSPSLTNPGRSSTIDHAAQVPHRTTSPSLTNPGRSSAIDPAARAPHRTSPPSLTNPGLAPHSSTIYPMDPPASATRQSLRRLHRPHRRVLQISLVLL